MGIPLDRMVLWNWRVPNGGLTAEQLERAQVILWQGHCSTHQRFTVDQIEKARREYPDVQVIVHPECRWETVQAADFNGSTEKILTMINEAPAGTTWAVGTEINLVNRIAQENPDKKVFCLDPVVCPCSTMYRIHPAYVGWVLEGLVGRPRGERNEGRCGDAQVVAHRPGADACAPVAAKSKHKEEAILQSEDGLFH